MTNEEAANELKNYHREDGTVPEEITLAIKALETGEVYMTGEDYNLYMEGYKAGKKDFEPKQGEPVIKCQDCKYRVKEWREDKRMKEKGYWVYGCNHFGEIMGYWGFGGNDNEFCSDAEQKGGAV